MTLLRGLGIVLAISFVTGLLLAFATGPSNLLLRAFAMSGAFASPFCGYFLGERLRARGTGHGRLVLLSLILAAGVLFFAWGLFAPPVIGESENQFLFPGLLLIGVLAGVLGRGG